MKEVGSLPTKGHRMMEQMDEVQDRIAALQRLTRTGLDRFIECWTCADAAMRGQALANETWGEYAHEACTLAPETRAGHKIRPPSLNRATIRVGHGALVDHVPGIIGQNAGHLHL